MGEKSIIKSRILECFTKFQGPLKHFCKIFKSNVCGWYDVFVIAALDQALPRHPNYLFYCLNACLVGGENGRHLLQAQSLVHSNASV